MQLASAIAQVASELREAAGHLLHAEDQRCREAAGHLMSAGKKLDKVADISIMVYPEVEEVPYEPFTEERHLEVVGDEVEDG